jgi:hypothetical protein
MLPPGYRPAARLGQHEKSAPPPPADRRIHIGAKKAPSVRPRQAGRQTPGTSNTTRHTTDASRVRPGWGEQLCQQQCGPQNASSIPRRAWGVQRQVCKWHPHCRQGTKRTDWARLSFQFSMPSEPTTAEESAGRTRAGWRSQSTDEGHARVPTPHCNEMLQTAAFLEASDRPPASRRGLPPAGRGAQRAVVRGWEAWASSSHREPPGMGLGCSAAARGSSIRMLGWSGARVVGCARRWMWQPWPRQCPKTVLGTPRASAVGWHNTPTRHAKRRCLRNS